MHVECFVLAMLMEHLLFNPYDFDNLFYMENGNSAFGIEYFLSISIF